MAEITVLFFASLKDEIGVGEVKLAANDIDELMIELSSRFGEDKARVLFKDNIRIAVDKELVEGNYCFNGNEEVAFLPPVTGG